jgi:hypothetical protein
VFEIDTATLKKKRNQFPENPDEFLSNFLYIIGNNILSERIDFTADMTFVNSSNVESYDVYINDDYYGTDVEKIQITTNDILRIEVIKNDESLEAVIEFDSKLV